MALAPADMAIVQRAYAALQAGRAGDADRLLGGLSLAARIDADAAFLAALTAEALGRFEESRRRYQAALRAGARNPAIWNGYGGLLRRMGDAAGAAEAWRQAVALAPGFVDGWINLGIIAAELPDWAGGRAALARAAALAPQDARVPAALGSLEVAAGEPAAAATALQAALKRNPADLVSRHNLASALRGLGDAEGALAALETAIRAGLTAPETATMRGHVLADLGRFDAAVAQYRAVVAAVPAYVPAQTALVELLPMLGRAGEALDGWRALLARPAAPELWAAGIAAARGLGDHRTMLAWADAAGAAHGAAPDWAVARAFALNRLGQRDAAIDTARATAAAHPETPAAQTMLAWLLLQAGDAAAAEAPALAATALAPLDQSPWSLLGLIWRLRDDPREAWLIDYQRLVLVADLQVPPGWRDLPAFLADLATVLGGRHNMLQAPADQSLRGGTQTRGKLFETGDPVLKALEASLTATIDAALAELEPEAGHPFLGRLGRGARITSSWSVRLASEGFHISHIHPQGWLSSAFYIALPPEIGAGSDAGALQFGVPEAALGIDLPPRRVVTPAPGRLVLFPSYAWHGTVPFTSATPRLTAAVDAVPVV